MFLKNPINLQDNLIKSNVQKQLVESITHAQWSVGQLVVCKVTNQSICNGN